ncbi:ACT domain-containing protein [Desulforamulus ferrireducens]|uniref:Amino acid-binding protein n=1 Tax=Desulforamulus ferrireducens TaxID=1833852 RepID=A0A1S6IZ41_9FIRM|nr:ACT domain-containing protein [Desulforamulus ferrireducens]AQS60038.1 amino acid-binding protein [Desulforamulus ferrireducens]
MSLTLTILPELLSICRLAPEKKIPSWAVESNFFSITKTIDELSIVCPTKFVPSGIQCDNDWRALKIEGPLDFSLIGILSAISTVLAREGISIFALSTFDTDYILVKKEQLKKAVDTLKRNGYIVN